MDINESPVYLLLHPSINHAQKDLPLSIYESGMFDFHSDLPLLCIIIYLYVIINPCNVSIKDLHFYVLHLLLVVKYVCADNRIILYLYVLHLLPVVKFVWI